MLRYAIKLGLTIGLATLFGWAGFGSRVQSPA